MHSVNAVSDLERLGVFTSTYFQGFELCSAIRNQTGADVYSVCHAQLLGGSNALSEDYTIRDHHTTFRQTTEQSYCHRHHGLSRFSGAHDADRDIERDYSIANAVFSFDRIRDGANVDDKYFQVSVKRHIMYIYIFSHDVMLNCFFKQISDSPVLSHLQLLKWSTLDTLFSIAMPLFCTKNKIFRDDPYNHHIISGVQALAFRGYSDEFHRRNIVTRPHSVSRSRSGTATFRATVKTIAVVMRNLHLLSQHYAIFFVNYNNKDHCCHDVASHCWPDRGDNFRWECNFNLCSIDSQCTELGRVASENWKFFSQLYRRHSEGSDRKRCGSLLEATHMTFVPVCQPMPFGKGTSIVHDVGGIVIPLLIKCKRKEITVSAVKKFIQTKGMIKCVVAPVERDSILLN